MSDVLLDNSPPLPPANAAPSVSCSDLVPWLGSLLDAAHDREDAALARLIAGVMDDLRAAKG